MPSVRSVVSAFGVVGLCVMPSLSVNVAPVADVKHSDCLNLIINFVNHPVLSSANPPAFSPRQLPASARPCALSERRNCRFHFFVGHLWQGGQFTLGPAEDEDGVTHLRERSISWVAFENGIRSSLEVFAVSYARIDSSSSISARIFL